MQILKLSLLLLLAVVLCFNSSEAKPRLKTDSSSSSQASVQYVKALVVGALSEEFFQKCQYELIPNIIKNLTTEFANVNFPWFPFYLYKLDGQPKNESVFFNMSVTNFNITQCGYNIDSTTSGILLVESIQTLKYYFNNITFRANFFTNVDFSGLFYDNYELNNEKYYSEIELNPYQNQVSLSVSQKFSVNSTTGDIMVDLPAVSLTLSPENLNLTFPNQTYDFSSTIKRVFTNLRNYFLYNSNSLIQDNKQTLQMLHQIVAQFTSEISISYNGYTLISKYLSREDITVNPIINSNYISGIQTVGVIDPNGQYHTIPEDQESYLPIIDQSGSHFQYIVSQGLLQQIITIIWTSTDFLKNNNPTLKQDFVSFKNDTETGDLVPENCTIDVLERQFKGITAAYGTNLTCNMTLNVTEIKNFTINTGRLYSTNNNTISQINISLYDNVTQEYKDSIVFEMPVETMYFNLKLTGGRMRFQIYNAQPADFTLLYPENPAFDWNSTALMETWNNKLKTPMIKYYNLKDDKDQGFALARYMYAWISDDVLNSFTDFKLDLYDKFIIMNFTPDYQSQAIINVISSYFKSKIIPFIIGGEYGQLPQELQEILIQAVMQGFNEQLFQ